MASKHDTADDGAPVVTMTADALSELLRKGAKPVDAPPEPADAPAKDTKKEPEESANTAGSTTTPTQHHPTVTASDSATAAVTPTSTQAEHPPIPIPTFGPPTTPITTEMILGRPLVQTVVPQAAPPTPATAEGEQINVGPRKPLSDPTERAARAERAEEAKSKHNAAIGRLLADYPSTRMVNIRLQWRDPVTRSYCKKGRIKNVSLNDVRDPESWCEGPDGTVYGGDWIISYQPADQGKHFDDPKSWYSFEFDRDGPPPPPEWTIDQPRYEKLTVEVEGMGQIPVSELTKIIQATVADTLKAQNQAQQSPAPAPVNPPPPTMSPGFPPHGLGASYGGLPPTFPMRDPKADEREKRLEEQLNKQREQIDALVRQLAERDRQAAEERARAEREAAEARARAERAEIEARHNAELAALKSSFQSALEAITSKLSGVEQRVNSLPATPPQRDDLALLTTLKEIVVGNRNVDAEERRRELEERQRRLEEERAAREREREEARERREREREEERLRREEERTRREMADREAQRMLEQYRMMGESALQSARAVAEITSKRDDPSPALTVMNAMAQQQVQNAQLLATLFKNFGQGGGGGGTNWPELIAQLAPDAFRAVGDIATAIAEASAAKAKAAAQAAQVATVALPPRAPAFAGTQAPVYRPAQPQPAPQPAQQPTHAPQTHQQAVPATPRTPQPEQPPTQAPVQQPPPSPLSALIAGVNRAIAEKEAPEKVAGKLASIVHVAQEFGTNDVGRAIPAAIRALTENPLKFLKRAYPQADQDYLKQIADTLISEYGGETEGREEEDKPENTESETETRTANTEVEGESTKAEPTTEPEAQETEHRQQNEQETRAERTASSGNGRKRRGRRPRTQAELPTTDQASETT